MSARPKNLPTVNPSPQGIEISPEGLSIAETYLQTGDIDETALALGLERSIIVYNLSRHEVRNYVDTVFLNAGYASRSKVFDAMSKIIDAKLLELEEAEIGSSKDIAELLQMMHKMRIDEINAMAKLEAARTKGDNVKRQVNIQVNDGVGGQNYNALLEKLIHSD